MREGLKLDICELFHIDPDNPEALREFLFRPRKIDLRSLRGVRGTDYSRPHRSRRKKGI